MVEVSRSSARSNLVVTAKSRRELAAIRSDRQKVEQILLNLLTNALEFTPRGPVTVSCTHQRSTRELAIAVADTGIGIPEADQARSSRPSAQADPRLTRRTRGPVSDCDSRRLAAVLGGRITLESELRQGSTFTLVLPLGRSGDDEEARGAGDAKNAAGGNEDGPLVLIVDDVQDNQTVYMVFLEFSGFRVAKAENGANALRRPRRSSRTSSSSTSRCRDGRLGGHPAPEARPPDEEDPRRRR